MAVSAGAEDPGAVTLFGVRLGVENAGAEQVLGVKLRVLGVHVENGILEHANRADGIDLLPEKMAGIVIAAHVVPGDRAQFQHGLGIVGDKSGMHLHCNFHSVIGSEFCVLLPVGRDDFVPLPVENFAEIRRPRASDPVGSYCVGRVAGTSGEIHHYGHT